MPETLDEMLSPAWLTEVLGVRVRSVTPGPVVARVATNARFTIELDEPAADDAPLNLCAKGFFAPGGAVVPGTGQHEALFYRDLVGLTGVRTLRHVYAEVTPDSDAGLILTRDVVAEENAEFLDSLHPYTPDQAAESLSQLAQLHSATWENAGLADVDWLAPRLSGHLLHRGFAEINGNFTGPIGAGVPDAVRDAQKLVDAYRHLATLVETASPWCVIHGDPHIGNVYLDAEKRPSFLDWQLAMRAPWYLDVGYHIASALTIEDRRANERDLLRHYLERLAAGGVDAPPFDEAWEGLRKGVVAGFYLWGITLKVNPAITTVLLTRIGTAAADHDSLNAVLSAH